MAFDHTGGPAFPAPNDANVNGQAGMSLRDYFAAQAMLGLLSDPSRDVYRHKVAERAYMFADLMLNERLKYKMGALKMDVTMKISSAHDMPEWLKTAAAYLFVECEPCGSRVTCNPPPLDTDQDFIALIAPGEQVAADTVSELYRIGFKWDGNEYYQTAVSDGFMSWRKGDINLIVTSNPIFYQRHRAATALCARLNLMDKGERVALFQAVLYGNHGNKRVAKAEDFPF